MKILYIHIGTPKTATTSLQHFCKENADILEEKGYCYPIFVHKFKHVSILRNGFFLSYKEEEEKGKRNFFRKRSFSVREWILSLIISINLIMLFYLMKQYGVLFSKEENRIFGKKFGGKQINMDIE